ncbi:MAG: TRAP transporter small permease [Burkholderiaceae bacterium]|nr:TRAP transporter small permease [Burkholderiaceae bacterium]
MSAGAASGFGRLVDASNRASAALARVIDGFGIAMLSISAGITFLTVIMRYGFGYSEQILEEIARYTVVYACLVYVGPLQARHQHIAVDVISSRFAPSAKRAWQFLLGVLFLAITAIVFASGWLWVRDLHGYNMMVIGGTMPAWIPSLSVPLGMGLAVLFALAEVLRLGLALVSPTDPGSPRPGAALTVDAIN